MQNEQLTEQNNICPAEKKADNRFLWVLRVYFINFFDSIKIIVLKKINEIDNKFGYPFDNNPKAFDDLTPSIIENEETYARSIFWALKNKNIKNIALTGSYGSGKSSIIKTFKEKYKQFDYLNISLATFEDCTDENKVKNKPKTKEEILQREELNQKIELSILQQMLYIEKSKTLPNSRFKRIRNFKNHNLYLNTFFGFITVLGYIFLFQRELILKVCLTYNFFIVNADNIEVVSGVLLLIGIFYLIKSFTKTFSDFKFSKINLKGDVELNREISDNSILNKNLDEIIYFFERTNYNVVFIEDLDRFKEPEIFTKLREINLLINLSKQVNRHIVFIYALKDEMFVDGNRTKFFDFIIPVIPVINSSNSYEILSDKLKDFNISENLLDDISLYIDDMRLLKNIINEYKIYHEKLTKDAKIDLIPNKLISFIIYKNLHPEDFAKLHRNRGMVYNLFNTDIREIKKIFIDKNNKKIEEEIDVNIENIKLLKINNVADLRKLYILKLFQKLPERTRFINLSQKFSINQVDELIEDSVFKEILVKKSFIYIIENYDRRYLSYDEEPPKEFKLTFKEIEDEVDSNFNYLEKEKLITQKENNEIDNYNKEIQIIKEKNNVIRRSSSEEVLRISDSLEGINEELKKSDVLIYLIRKGFIAEDYFDYISIFYDLKITRNDKNYILSIRNNKPLPIDFKLSKVDEIIKKINEEYSYEATLNIDLVNHLLEKNQNDAILELFKQFNNQSERTNNFIETYISSGKYTTGFVKAISKTFEGFWDFIGDSSLSNDDKDFVLKEVLLNVELDDVINLNKSKKLYNYIVQKADFLNLIYEKSKNVEEILNKLDVKFKNPLDSQANSDLFDFIYKNNLYEINEKMIEQIVIEKSEEDIIVKNLLTSNYSTILKSKCEFLINYINEKIEYYINNVFLKIEDNISESEKNIIDLLNNDKLDDDTKLLIINKENFVINSLIEIDDSILCIELIQKNKVKPTWENVITYSNEDEFEETIIDYLNIKEHYSELAESNFKDLKLDADFEKTFIKKLVSANSLTDDAYKFLIRHIDETVEDLDFKNIDDSKIEILIDKGIIEFSKENFESLREFSENKQILLLAKNFENYIELSDDEDIDEEEKIELDINELEILLNSKNLINDKNKVKIINQILDSQITEKNNLGNIICNFLVNLNPIVLSFSFFSNVIKFSKNLDNKIKLSNLYNNLFLRDKVKTEVILNNLGSPFSSIVTVGVNKPPITSSEWNVCFIENLKKSNYIGSYSNKNSKITKIRKN